MVQFRKGKPSPWVVQYRVKEVTSSGKIVSRVKTASFATEKQAQEFRNLQVDKKRAIRHGLKVPTDSSLMLDFFRDWLKRRSKNPEIAHSSFVGEESKIRRDWAPKIGHLPANMVSTSIILENLDDIQFNQGKSPATRNRHRALLHTIFQDAMMRNKCEVNPVSKIPLVKEVRTKKRVDIKEEEQFEAYLAGLLEEGREYWVIGNILGYAGVRICTANAFQYQDIDQKRGVLLVRRIEERAGGSKIVERIKGKQSIDDEQDIHVMPLFPVLARVIEETRRISRFNKPTDFIACNPATGSYVPYDTWKDVHRRVVEKKNLPPITSHAIRRFFATQAKKHGFSRAELRELGGWSSEQVVGRYDIKDVQHLADKARALGFGEIKKPRIVSIRGGRK